MAAPPDNKDKQSRLSTLSQDVIAVPRQPAAPAHAERPSRQEAPERPAERTDRKAMPSSQDVFKVSSPEPPAIPTAVPRSARRPAARGANSLLQERIPVATWVAAGLAGLALLLAGYAVLSGGAATAHAAQNAQFEVKLKAAAERIARLEEQLSAASADAEKLDAPGRINTLQLSAGIRSLRNDLDMVANEVASITVQVGEIRTLAAGGSKDAKLALAQIEQVGARVATLNEQLAGAPRTGTGGGGDAQAQLKSLAQKTDKMAADIRQLYRQIGSQ